MLGLERLELRRLHADLIYCFNIIHNFTCLCPDDFFTLSDVTATRGNDLKLVLPVSRVDCRKYFLLLKLYIFGIFYQMKLFYLVIVIYLRKN